MSRRLTTEEFIEKAKIVHGDKYDYSKVEYVNTYVKICIICPEHGEFWQSPSNHLQGKGCFKCGYIESGLKNSLSTKVFIEKSKEIHGDFYDYSKVKYINNHTKVCIVCPIHGDFFIRPMDHLQGQGCGRCFNERRHLVKLKSTSCFINEAKIKHCDFYHYSKVKYINNDTKVCIICPKHGEFWQTPHNHLKGQGCPKCNSSKLEQSVRLALFKKINFLEQHSVKNMGNQKLDFYLPDYNIAIECQGKQHFKDDFRKTQNFNFTKQIERDIRKDKICRENGIKLLYYTSPNILLEEYLDNDLFERIYTKDNVFIDIDKLISNIINNNSNE